MGAAATVVPAIADMVAELVAEVGAENVTIMGDSAGGTITLAVAMRLRDRGLPAPHGTILISPALDLALTDPAIARIAPATPGWPPPGRGPWRSCGAASCRSTTRWSAPSTGTSADWRRSSCSAGRATSSTPTPGASRKARAAGFPLDYHEAPGMLHVYPLLPIPEANGARAVMERVLKG